jgi:hypothetical protein
MKGPRHASVIEGTMEPLMETIPYNRRIRRKLVGGGRRGDSMSMPKWRRAPQVSTRWSCARVDWICKLGVAQRRWWRRRRRRKHFDTFNDGKLATSQMGSRLWCGESVRPIYYLLMVGRCKHIISFHIFIPENESKYGFYRLSLISEKHGMHWGLKTI